MGVAATAKVVTSTLTKGRPFVTQPGNREWVTVVELINATRWALPPMIILEGKVHQSIWYDDATLPSNWVIGLSDTDWTNDALGLQWIKEVFDKLPGAVLFDDIGYLILDGHSKEIHSYSN